MTEKQDYTKYYLAAELKDEAALMAEHDHRHKKIWSEITKIIKRSAIVGIEIFRRCSCRFIIHDADTACTFQRKIVRVRERLMWTYQHPFALGRTTGKWIPMKKKFFIPV